jgi:hypothetical protein
MAITLKKKVPTPPRGRIAKARFAVMTAWKVLRRTFAAGAVKGATKQRVKNGGAKRRLIPLVAGAGAVAGAAFAAGRKHAKATAVSAEEPHPQPFPNRPPLHPADTAAASEAPDPSVQSLTDG